MQTELYNGKMIGQQNTVRYENRTATLNTDTLETRSDTVLENEAETSMIIDKYK